MGSMLTKITQIARRWESNCKLDFACEYYIVSMFRNASNTFKYIKKNLNLL